MDSNHPAVGNLVLTSLTDAATIRRRAARQRTLASAATSLLSQVGAPEFPRTLLVLACTLLAAQRGSLYAVNQAGETVIAVSADVAEPSPKSALDTTRLAADLLHRTLPLIVDCADDPQARERFCDGGECSFVIGVPLQWNGRLIGVMQLERGADDRRLDADELSALSQFVELAGAALARHLTLTADAPAEETALRLTEALREVMSHSVDLSASLSASLAAVEQERRRIGSELHDGVRSSLLGAQLQLEAVRADLRIGAVDAGVQQLQRVQQTLAAADSEMSRIVRALRPPVLAEAGLAAALFDLGLRWSTTTGISLSFDLEPGTVAPAEATAMALYRCAQEALSNIARHSGASAATLSLRRADATLNLVVSDDGKGNAAPRGGGVGLFSISERAHSIGAALQIESPPGRGTRVTVTLPLDN